jgi:AraC-like DNA-binding protein
MEKTFCMLDSKDESYTYFHKSHPHPLNEDFVPHIHDSIEIYMFIKGNVEYIVEGNRYALSPYDVLILNENELHNAHILGDTDYERAVINIKPSFFDTYGINNYKNIFTNRKHGTFNLIKGYIAQTEGLYTILMRMEQYINDSTPENDMIVRAAIIEFLHILNRINSDYFNSHEKKSLMISDILAYINKNLSAQLTLEETANNFFISKHHLCRIFKQHTGLTFTKYVNAKRVALVKSLCKNDMTISEAIEKAGFTNYSNFYRVYVSLTGHCPKTDLKNTK